MSCICPEKVVCGKMGVVGKDGDVEMLRFRKVRRKERAKMKQVGSATNARMQGCQAQQELVPNPPQWPAGAQQGSAGRWLNRFSCIMKILTPESCIVCM